MLANILDKDSSSIDLNTNNLNDLILFEIFRTGQL